VVFLDKTVDVPVRAAALFMEQNVARKRGETRLSLPWDAVITDFIR